MKGRFHERDDFKPTIYNFPLDVVKGVYNDLKGIFTNFMCETDDDIWLVKEDFCPFNRCHGS